MLQIRVIVSSPGNVVVKHFLAHYWLQPKASLLIYMLNQNLLVIVCHLIIHLEKYRSMPCGSLNTNTEFLCLYPTSALCRSEDEDSSACLLMVLLFSRGSKHGGSNLDPNLTFKQGELESMALRV